MGSRERRIAALESLFPLRWYSECVTLTEDGGRNPETRPERGPQVASVFKSCCLPLHPRSWEGSHTQAVCPCHGDVHSLSATQRVRRGFSKDRKALTMSLLAEELWREEMCLDLEAEA